MADSTAPAPPQQGITQEEFLNYLKSPILFPPEFKEWVSDWFGTNVPKLHVSQIYGFKLQSVKIADANSGAQVMSSSSYTAFDDGGLTFSNVPNGFYLLFFGATFSQTGGEIPTYTNLGSAYIAPIYDGSTADDGEACVLNAGTNGRVTLIDLTGGANDHTISFQYKRDAALGSNFQLYSPWAFLLKVVTDANA